ncbi:MAG: aminotransferase class I/II-fold pyridoxal phosphate-dependent enzyme [Rubrivivax sp.]|nr:MAG: aminotransferase class I/II-fold pyridoxal phosphate-dependent enzyme [Rubrivivax sp.]
MDKLNLALQGTLADYVSFMDKAVASGRDSVAPESLLGRLSILPMGWDILDEYGLDTHSKQIVGPVLPWAQAKDRRGRPLAQGVNFGSQDYLSLSNHPAVREAAMRAIEHMGVHVGGSAALMGNSEASVQLERELGSWLHLSDCSLFPTGWAAGYGAIRALVRERDHVVIDRLAHACLQDGARAATRNVHTFEHLSTQALEKQLAALRQSDPFAGILVVTESLFSMDSDVPDLQAHQELAHRYQATLLLDVAHDLGSMGPDGLGAMQTQGMLGKIDVVMGTFSKTFASNGGFVASNEPGLKLAIRFGCGPHTFSNALSPVQAQVVLKALEIVQSPEGAERRRSLHANSLALRAGLTAQGCEVMGVPSAVVPVLMGGTARCRMISRFLLAGGAIANAVEFPAVPRDAARLRLQVMADHTDADIDTFLATLETASSEAEAMLTQLRQEQGVAAIPLPNV